MLIKIADGVWEDDGLVQHWGAAQIAFLESAARNTAKRRARILAHKQTDGTHQMLIAFCADSRNPMHSHAKPESMLVLKGSMLVRFIGEQVVLNVGEFLRIPGGVEHEPEPLSDCVVLETVER